MRSVGLDELRNDLGAYVRAAERGETLLVTDDDRVVAELVPPRLVSRVVSNPTPAARRDEAFGDDPMTDEEFIAKGAREGWLTPATIRDGSPPPAGRRMMSLEELLGDLERDREDR